MKKILLLATAIFTFGAANAQSNQKGTIHLNLIGGFITGSGTDKFSDGDFKYTGTGAQYGIQGQYGITESFSAGIGFEFGAAVLTPKDLSGDNFGTYEPTLSTFKVNVSGRYYIVNKDSFNFYAGPSLGFTSGKDELSIAGFGFDTETPETKYSGLNLGLNTGINYYFNDTVGGIFQIGYESDMLKSKANADEESYKRNIGGLKIMAGLSLKF